jgi:hypothetical protein
MLVSMSINRRIENGLVIGGFLGRDFINMSPLQGWISLLWRGCYKHGALLGLREVCCIQKHASVHRKKDHQRLIVLIFLFCI